MKAVGYLVLLLILALVLYIGVQLISTQLDFGSIFTRPGRSTSTATNAPPRESPYTITTEKKDSGYQVGFEKPSGLQLIQEPPPGFTQKDLSPLYYGQIDIGSVRRPFSSGDVGELTLRLNYSQNLAVDITNWRIKSNRGEMTILGGQSDFGPVNQKRIILRPGSGATIYFGATAPVQNVQTNLCTGYLNNIYNLNPKLPNNCPQPDRNQIVTFSGACQNFIFSLSSCETPTAEELNRFTSPADIDCHEFLEDLNYQNCYDKNYNKPSFFSDWRVWLNQNFFIDTRDRLLLLDDKGLLVDVYSY